MLDKMRSTVVAVGLLLALALALAGCRSVAGYTPGAGDAGPDGLADARALDGAGDGSVGDGSVGDGVDGNRSDAPVDRGADGAPDARTDADRRDAAGQDLPKDAAGPPGSVPPALGCSAGTWCWDHPRPTGNDLNDVFCTTTACFAVGLVGTLVYQQTGDTSWTQLRSDTSENLRGVWVDAATGTIVVVGDNGTIRVWDGQAWQVLTVPDVTPDFVAVWGRGSKDFYMGSAVDTTVPARQGVWHLTGKNVTKVDGAAGLRMWGHGSRVFVVGPSSVRELGTGFVATCAATLVSLSGVSGPALKLFVLADAGAILEVDPASPAPSCSSTSNAAGLTAPRALHAVSAQEFYVGHGKGISYYKTGSGWSPMSTVVGITAIARSGSGVLVAAGQAGGLFAGSGAGWSEQSSRVTVQTLSSAAGDNSMIYASGNNGTLLKRAPSTGSTWSPVITGLGTHLNALAVDPNGTLRAADSNGYVHRLLPVLQSVPVAAGNKLFAITKPNQASTYYVGGEKTLMACTIIGGTDNCTPFLTAGFARTARAILDDGGPLTYVATHDLSLAVPEQPVFVSLNRATGADAAQLESTSGIIGSAIHGLATLFSQNYAVGAGGWIFVLPAGAPAWTAMTTPKTTVKGNLNAIAGKASDDLWVVGEGGILLHWNGAAWTRQGANLTRQTLRSVVASLSDNQLWAVGSRGAILRYNP